MTVIPYSRFQECQDRRQRILAEMERYDPPPTLDAEAKPKLVPAGVAPAQPLKANS
jgi:hypothetical protein